MSDITIALVVTLVLLVGLLVWGVTVHHCCGWKHRRRARREDAVRNLSTMR